MASPREVCDELCSRLRTRRLEMRLPQAELAARAGVSVGTVKNAEARGPSVSLEGIVRIAIALELAEQLQALFIVPVRSIQQMEQVAAAPRQRARKPRDRS